MMWTGLAILSVAGLPMVKHMVGNQQNVIAEAIMCTCGGAVVSSVVMPILAFGCQLIGARKEEECKRLRQSIKCGLISRLTVGEILDKTTEIQVARVNDWLESETLRLSHLRDRASDMGRRKELRECVEKLQLLKIPEERRRRLEELPEIHADPKLDPNYESGDNDNDTDDNKRDAYVRSKMPGSRRRERGPISSRNDNLRWCSKSTL